jgi:hypothetical protein
MKRRIKMTDELKFDKFGWITINWMEDGYLHHQKFDMMSTAKKFLSELKKRGLK